MKVFIVLRETRYGYHLNTNVEKVFSNEKKADQYVEEQNKVYHNSYHWVEEMEIEEREVQ